MSSVALLPTEIDRFFTTTTNRYPSDGWLLPHRTWVLESPTNAPGTLRCCTPNVLYRVRAHCNPK